MQALFIQPTEDDYAAACSCCAGEAGLRGFVYEGEDARAVYFAEPAGVPKYPMIRLGIVIGKWAGDTTNDDRFAMVLSCKPGASGPDMTPIEPHLTTFPELNMLGTDVPMSEATGHKAFADVLEVARAVINEDSRLVVIRDGEGSRARKFVADSGE